MSAVATPSASSVKAIKAKKGKEKHPKVEPKKPTKGKKPAPEPKKIERTYGLTPEEVKEIKSETEKGKIPNPYRPGSSYFTLLNCLASFGLNKDVGEKELIARFCKLATPEYLKAFKSKKPRNKETGLDWQGRLIQSAVVLCRQRDYGKPLVDCGIDLTYETSDGVKTFVLKRSK